MLMLAFTIDLMLHHEMNSDSASIQAKILMKWTVEPQTIPIGHWANKLKMTKLNIFYRNDATFVRIE